MLKKLTIHKFRCCEETTVDLDRPLSALCGKNGVGKSTILKAIDWVARAAISSSPLTSMMLLQDEPSTIQLELILGEIHYTYLMKCLIDGVNIPGPIEEFSVRESDGALKPIFARKGYAIRMIESGRTLRIARSTPAAEALLGLLPPDDAILPHVHSLVDFLSRVRYYPFDTTGSEERSVNERDYLSWKGQYEGDGVATDSVVLRLVYLWHEKKALFHETLSILGPDGLDLVEIVNVFTPPARAQDSTGANGELPPETRLYVPVFKIAEAMGGAGKNLAFADLSEGTRRIIRLVTSLIFDQRSLMMIEQPEDAIHPGLLHKLIDLLKAYSDRTQVILATHSPAVLDALEPEDILLVTAPRGVTRARRLSADDLDHARSFLQNDGSLSEFLEPMVEELPVEDAG
jgi:predicted ATPase